MSEKTSFQTERKLSYIDTLRNNYSAALDVVEALERYILANADDDDACADSWDSVVERLVDFKEQMGHAHG